MFIPDVPQVIVCKRCHRRYNPITKAHVTAAWNEQQRVVAFEELRELTEEEWESILMRVGVMPGKRRMGVIQLPRHDDNQAYLDELLGVRNDDQT